MDYDIIATLGPASETEATWQAMLDAGASGFRLNTSHLSLEQLAGWLKRLEPFLSSLPQRPPLVLDLQGSKWRLGQFSPRELSAGQPVELVLGAQTERAEALPVPHADFFLAAALSNGEIVLNDAKVRLQLEAQRDGWLRARVTQGGPISAHKGITFSASAYRSETLSEKDQAILAQTREFAREVAHGFAGLSYAISYIKDAAEMTHYRGWFGPEARLIAKLERAEAMREAAQIAENADELWVCRGDLGAELGLPGMAEAVYRLNGQVRQIRVPVLLAGQVLEHMTTQPTPTRSEICCLHDALAAGYRGAVLSDEAAIGRYPVESCRAAALFKK